jgi:hypothetical protein
MNRLRRAWAALGAWLDTPPVEIARHGTFQRLRAENASLRASLDDAHRQHAIASAKAAGLERVLRTIHENADQGLANPTENGR